MRGRSNGDLGCARLLLHSLRLDNVHEIRKTMTMSSTITMKIVAANLTGTVLHCVLGSRQVQNDNDYVTYHSVGNATICAANLVDSPCSALVGNRSFAQWR